jgi:predicted MPP superfamily phosphohydrolase
MPLLFVLFCLCDWLLLTALPHLRLSFPRGLGLPLGASLFVRVLLLGGLLGAALLSHWRGDKRSIRTQTNSATILFLALNLGFSYVQIDAYVLEPLLVETTELSLASDKLDPDAPPVRVIQLTDTHVERNSYRERDVIQRVNALRPDIIVLTGDYLNISYSSDPTAAAHFRQFVAQLEAPYGIYAVRGSVEWRPASMSWLLEGTDIVWLEQESVTLNVHGQSVTLVGVACSHRGELDAQRLTGAMAGIDAGDFTLLLYHSPDLILEAAEQEVNLYLGGHTHGGQIRLPVFGPIVTFSRYGRRYAAGLFREGGTTMYVSRGLGFEGGDMPRTRFLCRPEIVSFELVGSRESTAEVSQ